MICFWWQEFDPCEDLTDDDIHTAIRNATGPRSALFVPEVGLLYQSSSLASIVTIIFKNSEIFLSYMKGLPFDF